MDLFKNHFMSSLSIAIVTFVVYVFYECVDYFYVCFR